MRPDPPHYGAWFNGVPESEVLCAMGGKAKTCRYYSPIGWNGREMDHCYYSDHVKGTPIVLCKNLFTRDRLREDTAAKTTVSLCPGRTMTEEETATFNELLKGHSMSNDRDAILKGIGDLLGMSSMGMVGTAPDATAYVNDKVRDDQLLMVVQLDGVAGKKANALEWLGRHPEGATAVVTDEAAKKLFSLILALLLKRGI